jgi:RNA 3'-terminal phosphate cyclase-like protein
METVSQGGCVDASNQSIALLFMALTPEDVSRVRLGRLSPYTVQFLRLMRDAFGITFKITPDRENQTLLMSCLGIGYVNLARSAQ